MCLVLLFSAPIKPTTFQHSTLYAPWIPTSTTIFKMDKILRRFSTWSSMVSSKAKLLWPPHTRVCGVKLKLLSFSPFICYSISHIYNVNTIFKCKINKTETETELRSLLGPVNPVSQTIFFLTFVITACEFHFSLFIFPGTSFPRQMRFAANTGEVQNLLFYDRIYFLTAKLSILWHQLAPITTKRRVHTISGGNSSVIPRISNFCHLPARWCIF